MDSRLRGNDRGCADEKTGHHAEERRTVTPAKDGDNPNGMGADGSSGRFHGALMYYGRAAFGIARLVQPIRRKNRASMAGSFLKTPVMDCVTQVTSVLWMPRVVMH